MRSSQLEEDQELEEDPLKKKEQVLKPWVRNMPGMRMEGRREREKKKDGLSKGNATEDFNTSLDRVEETKKKMVQAK